MRVDDDIDQQLTRIDQATLGELRGLWSEIFNTSPPRTKRKELLVRTLAFRLQEKAHGTFKPATQRRLVRLAEVLEANPDSLNPPSPRIKPGTRLIREWRGDTHELTAIDKGFTYRGKRYKSLTEVAEAITGTHRSGPVFCGLRKSHKGREARSDARD